MSLLALFGLSKSELPKPTEKQIRESRSRMAKLDQEIAERARKRVPTKEQLNKAIDL